MNARQIIISGLLTLMLLSGCAQPVASPTVTPAATFTLPASLPTDTLQPTLTPTLPPVIGAEPSPRVAVFYYPWYRTKSFDGYWDHWSQGGLTPPAVIASDFFPILGVYSSADPAVVAQHCAWLRQAGVGVIITSWWGIDSPTDQVVPLLLEMAERYGLKVAFHIEPYDGRSARRLLADVQYLYDQYGNSPAFYRTTAATRWQQDDRAKGLFFLWATRFPNSKMPPIEPAYWREAIDGIHNLPDGGVVLTDENIPDWVYEDHFDGMYNYGVLDIDRERGYQWAQSVPRGAWYVPGVNPGFSGKRIGLSDDLITLRQDGATYQDRWQAALSTGVEPAMVAITSFNEWHEGTQIEPAASGVVDNAGQSYLDYGALGPEGYLTLTRQWVDRFQATSWAQNTVRRIRLVSTSDWTTLTLVSGASWIQPELISASPEASRAEIADGTFWLDQPIASAEVGFRVEMVVEVMFSNWTEQGKLVFRVARGNLGYTIVEILRQEAGEWVVDKAFRWSGLTGDGNNIYMIEVPAQELFGAAP